MVGRKRRFASLALIMVLLVGAVSMFSTYLLYETSLNEQKVRLHELVQSQAALLTELGQIAQGVEGDGVRGVPLDTLLHHLSHAYTKFQIESDAGELTIGRKSDEDVSFLVVNGKAVTPANSNAQISYENHYAIPMKAALEGKTGTVIALDYRGIEVLAAYTPLFFQDETMGLVAKIDIDEIKEPFIRANLIIFGVGVALTLLGLIVFFKLSEPIIRDIQLREQNYRDLVQGANSLIIRINEDGKITFANSFARKLLVGEEGELVGRDFMSFLGAAQGHGGLDVVLQFFEQGENYSESALTLYNDSNGWVSWTVRLIEEYGRPRELLCIGSDVTKLHRANEAQREIEERFRAIAKASPVGIAITDMEGNLIYANERMHEMTQTTAVDLAGKGWLDRIHAHDKAVVKTQWLRGKFVHSNQVEMRLVTKENLEIWVLGQIVNLRSIQKEIVGKVLTFTDITPIKEAEQAMRQLTAAMEQAAEVVIITDIKGIITYVNPAFEVITGFSRQDALGKTPNILKSDDQNEAFYKELWETIARGEAWSGRFVNLRKNGRRYTQEANIGPIRNHDGQTTGYVCVARDISDQLVVEAQLRQAQKLESIGELAAGIAHEINTPTQYVTSNLQFLGDSFDSYSKMMERSRELVHYILERCKDTPDEGLQAQAESTLDLKEIEYLSEDVPNALSESEAGLKRIAEIVQSVKQLAHPGEVSKSYHSLNKIAQDAATVSTNEWKYIADIEYYLDDTLASIFCLKGEVGQVVLNLIVNSAHAIETKGAGGEERGTITLKSYQEGSMAVLEVSDTGIGMSPDIMERVFDPFFTTKDVGKGTGQGLAIAHNVVVNMHGGIMLVESKLGIGSTFIVKLPFEEQN